MPCRTLCAPILLRSTPLVATTGALCRIDLLEQTLITKTGCETDPHERALVELLRNGWIALKRHSGCSPTLALSEQRVQVRSQTLGVNGCDNEQQPRLERVDSYALSKRTNNVKPRRQHQNGTRCACQLTCVERYRSADCANNIA